MLREIESLLKERGPTAVADIALHLESAPDAIMAMLDTLKAKGRVEKLSSACNGACPGCPSADAAHLSIWRIAE